MSSSCEDSGDERDMDLESDSSFEAPSEVSSFLFNPWAGTASCDPALDYPTACNTLGSKASNAPDRNPQVTSLRKHLQAFSFLPEPNPEADGLWGCVHSTDSGLSVLLLLSTEEVEPYYAGSLPWDPENTEVYHGPTSRAVGVIGTRDASYFHTPSSADSSRPPSIFSTHIPPFEMMEVFYATAPAITCSRLSPLPLHSTTLSQRRSTSQIARSPPPAPSPIGYAAMQYRTIGAELLPMLLQNMLATMDVKRDAPARMMSTVCTELNPQEVVVFRRDLRWSMSTMFQKHWELDIADRSHEQDRGICHLFTSLYKGKLVEPVDIQRALRQLLDLSSTRVKGSSTQARRPGHPSAQAIRQNRLSGICVIINHTDERLCQRGPNSRVMHDLITALEKKVYQTENFLWDENKPEKVQQVINIVHGWFTMLNITHRARPRYR